MQMACTNKKLKFTKTMWSVGMLHIEVHDCLFRHIFQIDDDDLDVFPIAFEIIKKKEQRKKKRMFIK